MIIYINIDAKSFSIICKWVNILIWVKFRSIQYVRVYDLHTTQRSMHYFRNATNYKTSISIQIVLRGQLNQKIFFFLDFPEISGNQKWDNLICV